MQKISTMRTSGKKIFKGQLTIGLDLGDRSSSYCVLSEAGEVILEQKLPTAPEAMKQISWKALRSWDSHLTCHRPTLTGLRGHMVRRVRTDLARSNALRSKKNSSRWRCL
jgi:hypothetical protein